jgi:hypothetical protein
MKAVGKRRFLALPSAPPPDDYRPAIAGWACGTATSRMPGTVPHQVSPDPISGPRSRRPLLLAVGGRIRSRIGSDATVSATQCEQGAGPRNGTRGHIAESPCRLMPGSAGQIKRRSVESARGWGQPCKRIGFRDNPAWAGFYASRSYCCGAGTQRGELGSSRLGCWHRRKLGDTPDASLYAP